MTAFARIILIGRNKDMGKIIKLPVGVGVDGSAVKAPVAVRDTEYVCRECSGFGYDEHGECPRCHGDGTIDYAEEEAEEEDPDTMSVSLATGAQSHHHEGSRHPEHTVPLGLHRPVAPPVVSRQGTLELVLDGVAVVAGLAVFGMVAFFLMVIQ